MFDKWIQKALREGYYHVLIVVGKRGTEHVLARQLASNINARRIRNSTINNIIYLDNGSSILVTSIDKVTRSHKASVILLKDIYSGYSEKVVNSLIESQLCLLDAPIIYELLPPPELNTVGEEE